tara:strand:+ start:7210 stop:7392 length:183 start_codon:yes stop_codon:yes gene_type:complete
MNTLDITVENNNVVSRFNGEGEGGVVCSFTSEQAVQNIINAHNESEVINPSRQNATARRV